MNVEIAQRLAARRKQAGLSQEALAEQLGVSRQAVSKWERSESSPDTDNLIALAQLYGVSLDDLLYVEDEMRDDVAFEAADRAAERGVATDADAARGAAAGVQQPGAGAENSNAQTAGQGAAGFNASSATAASNGAESSSASSTGAGFGEDKSKAKVRIGLGGIHVLDGDDYVHVTWRDGVHVKDSKKGDEVHVGWNGVHVKEGSKGDKVHVSWDGIHVKEGSSSDRDPAQSPSAHAGAGSSDAANNAHAADAAWSSASDPGEAEQRTVRVGNGAGEQPASGPAQASAASQASTSTQAPASSAAASTGRAEGEWFGVTDDGIGGRDDEGNEFVVSGDGVVINGEHFDDWRDARDRYGYSREDRWYKPCGYTVNGERFDTISDAKAKYGPEVGKSIPVRKHYLREFEKSWVKFPYPLVVILMYLLLGILNGAWAMGLFLFLTIPVYYMVGHAVGRRRIGPLISGVYPIAVVAWFCWMAFVENQPHPAWVAFLTIPLVEWLVHSLSHWWRGRKREKAAAKAAPVEVGAVSSSAERSSKGTPRND